MTDSFSLTAQTTAADVHKNVVLGQSLSAGESLGHQIAEIIQREILLVLAAVDGDVAGTDAHSNAGDSRFSAASTQEISIFRHILSPYLAGVNVEGF
jgi:hypothetical protein